MFMVDSVAFDEMPENGRYSLIACECERGSTRTLVAYSPVQLISALMCRGVRVLHGIFLWYVSFFVVVSMCTETLIDFCFIHTTCNEIATHQTVLIETAPNAEP